MAISAREIVHSVKGMSSRPDFYSGRGAIMSDLDGNMLYAIYQKIAQKLGTEQANAFVTMVEKLETLSATNFLNALYALERNDWNLIKFNESNVDVSSDGTAFATVSESLFNYGRDDTEDIRLSFLRKIDFERSPKNKRKYCYDNEQ